MFRKPWSPNVSHFGFNGSIWGLVSWLWPQYLKLIILLFFGTPRLAQMTSFGYFAIIIKIVVSGHPISCRKWKECILRT